MSSPSGENVVIVANPAASVLRRAMMSAVATSTSANEDGPLPPKVSAILSPACARAWQPMQGISFPSASGGDCSFSQNSSGGLAASSRS